MDKQDNSIPTVSTTTSPKQTPKTPPRPIRDPSTPPPPPKRRRLHSTAIASPAARKPFKSPLAVSSASQPSFPLKASPPPTPRSSPPTPAPLTSTPSQPARTTRPKFKTPLKARAEDAEIRTLRERKRELERECAAVEERVRRASLDEEETIEVLISKWRRVAQDTATHLFAQFRDNPVSTAVSPTTWGQDVSNWGWDDQAQRPQDGGGGSGSGKDGTGEDPGQQQMMTMDLMLRGMGVDLGLIGWSVEEGGFVTE
ncbi:hypothetical protein BC937DRAFT_89025 [Endogone sp. FLAS-F59071]|nr:hypothetical protein BC937DRAFT_89025 [Endogone sp. FLAS-F59071]|eukprot:RUS22460.1 hypothetical protein BC937DRAFT_89025 [Endogone sp. FLAS-F59071]